MAYGIEKLSKVQLGIEGTSGSAVAATALLRGPAAVIKNDSEIVQPVENIGILWQTSRAYIPKFGASITLPETEATFEQLPYMLACAIQDTVTGVADGGTSGAKIYAYALPTTAQNTIKTATIEAGDNEAAHEMEYSFVKKFTLSGVAGEALKVTSDWVGRQKSSCSFTSVSPITVESILFGKGSIFNDAIGGTWGATQKTNTFLGFSLEFETGWQEIYTGDGALTFSALKCIGPSAKLKITYEHDDVAVAEDTAMFANTPRQVRLSFTGSATSGTGGTYSTKKLILDFVCLPIEVSPETKDGNNQRTITYDVVYDASATTNKVGQIIVVNALTALP